MKNETMVQAILKICDKHKKRLRWAMMQIKDLLPFTVQKVKELSDEEVAVVDQFIARFSKLQDLMGSQLFPALLDLSQEPGEYPAFIDKLNRLEKMNVISSAEDWKEFRLLRNVFTHDYPEDSEIQVDILNRTYNAAKKLLKALQSIKIFVKRFEF